MKSEIAQINKINLNNRIVSRLNNYAKPFLKWAGGKTQLLSEIEKNLPKEIHNDKFTYIEPFVGSGAVLFWVLNNFPNVEKAVINDINADLINTYKVISSKPKQLVEALKEIQNQFHSLQNHEEKKKEFYYLKRDLYNTRSTDKVTQASLFIFLNRTCFNGLYRVNRSNLFNVPMGSYKFPTICDEKNIFAVSEVLQKVEILNGDFEETRNFAKENTFFYFDPPYKPLNETSSFTAYAKDNFDDNEQIRLKDFCGKLNNLGHKWLLSNSDAGENFFEEIYSDKFIQKVKAKRFINSKANGRGELNEILITNYEVSEKCLFAFQT
jgi:DNA adenine methylase